MTRSRTSPASTAPIGVVLAGGAGIRMGGGKQTVALRGHALLRYPVSAMRLVLSEVAVIAKADTVLPSLEGAMLWIEPDLPRNPLLGISEAIVLAGGRPVLVCPGDMPFVTPELLSALMTTSHRGGQAVLATCQGITRPLLGCFQPSAAPLLEQAANGGISAEDAFKALEPLLVEVENEIELFDVDTPDDLLQASAMLDVQSPAPAASPLARLNQP